MSEDSYIATSEHPSADDVDPLLMLNSTLLLDALQQIRLADTIALLRHAITPLQEALDQPDSPLRAEAGTPGASEFSRGYLCGELEQIGESLTLERARYYTDRLIRAIQEIRTSPINDINLNRWKEYDEVITDSLWLIDRRDGSGVHNARYWGNFIPQIPRQLMLRYTKRGDWVIDPFAGSGTTFIEGLRLGRNTLGTELSDEVAAQTTRLLAREPNRYGVQSVIVPGDSTKTDYRELLERHGRQSAQLVVLHPPYFDIIKFSDDPRDLSNAPSVNEFLEQIGMVIDNVAPVLDRGRYLALVIGDKYSKGDWIPLGFQTMSEVLRRGFSLKSIIVKNFEDTSGKRKQKELWRYRALAGGFYVFKHEYIFLFVKQ